ncbi:metal cation transporter, ZIP family [Oesophagostomum dentatum]|uniref:Metal cation transporter, ZIP family n=1 Tax=Oesophagostomum dentatum TaxID=61180 RepID=A0A0B1TEM0_OESDE|nr:metal cation transporter, ZIP family [Oesophagostomum dentatum]
MDIVVLKAILLGAISLITIAFGLIPMRVMEILSHKSGDYAKRAALIISLLSCFAGGVFLGVSFLDLLPGALESFERFKKDANWETDYPWVPLLFMVGFFLVNIFEELISHSCNKSDEEWHSKRTKTAGTFVSAAHLDDCYVETESIDSKVAIVKSITFVLALMFHSSLEGFAFGVQHSTISVASLFCGIIAHKAVVSFSVGMKLVEAHPHRPCIVVALITALALVAPLGGCIGIFLQNSSMDMEIKDGVICLLVTLSLGTFIYITFFEIVVPESLKNENKFWQWLASVVGFAIIAFVQVFEAD